MTIRKQLIYLSIISIIVIFGSISAQLMSDRSSESGQKIHKTRYLSYILADEFRQTSMDLTRLCRTYVATGDQQYWDSYFYIVKWRGGEVARPGQLNKNLYAGKVKKQIDIMAELGFSETEFAFLKEASDNSNELISIETQAMETTRAGRIIDGPLKPQNDESPEDFALRILFDDRYHGEVKKIMEPVYQFFISIDQRTEKETNNASDSASLWLNASFVFQIVITLLFGLFILTIRFILKQLGGEPTEAVRIANEIADGNLKLERIGKINETGTLASALDRMAENLQTMFQDIIQGVQTLASAATELSAISTQMSSNVAQTAEKSNNVSASAEEMATNMSSVAAATEQTTTNIQTLVSAAEEMTATINEIAQNTAEGSETTAQAVETALLVSEKVDELGKAASEISKVTESIADISEQTNLLALNATIEAARAGEAGKGFAVVAGEIKTLAQQTAEATKEINSRIDGVQTTTTESVNAIKSIIGIISKINTIVTTVASAVEEQSATTHEISNHVSQAAIGVQESNKNVNQSSVIAGEVTRDITEISLITDDMNAGGKQVKISAEELSGLAKNLNKMVGRFKI